MSIGLGSAVRKLLWQVLADQVYNWRMAAFSTINQVELLARSMDRVETAMSPEFARYFRDLQLSEEDRLALNNLAEKARRGTLSPAEQIDLDEYRRVGRLVELMKVKAEIAVKS